MESQHAAPPPPPPAAPDEPAGADAPAPEEETPKKKHSFWRELPVLVVIAFVVALLIKTFLLQAFYIPSASMEPTLVEGDRVLVEKISYRLGEPERGDVVVFEKEFATAIIPAEDDPFWEDIGSAIKGLFGFPTGGTQDFIKRVIAVEGDTVEGREGRVYVNGEAIDEPYLAEGTETSPFAAVDVPKDMIFVMGDNRGNSDDSRAFGPIPVDEVVGHAFLLLWPPSDFDTL
ncbi:MAG TPA: signal peptidase I [Actinomycetota bacterium]|nr:signal peptidase I [Actinomycetota bacterium]